MAKHPFSQNLHSHYDRLLALQCLVRRFSREHNKEFQALVRMRDELAAVLREFGFGDGRFFFDPGIASELVAWFAMLEGRAGRKALRAGDTQRVAELLGKRPYDLLREQAIEAATDCLVKHLQTVEEVLECFNYCDHVCLLSLTTLCHGETLCRKHVQISSTPNPLLSATGRNGKHAVQKLPDEPELRLVTHRFEGDDDYNLDLACALLLSSEPQRFTSPSITIYDSLENPGIEAGGGRTLNLRIDLNRAPVEIDDALLYLRNALRYLLVEHHGMMANVPLHEEYLATNFAKKQDRLASIFTQKSEIQTAILGLWCWDLTEIKGLSLAASVRSIDKMRLDWSNQPSQDYDKMRQHLRKVKDLIAFPATAKMAKLDYAISQRNGFRLGRRDSERFDA